MSDQREKGQRESGRLARLPVLDGVIVERADAAWVTCNICEEQELIYGVDLRRQIKHWRDCHYEEEHLGRDF